MSDSDGNPNAPNSSYSDTSSSQTPSSVKPSSTASSSSSTNSSSLQLSSEHKEMTDEIIRKLLQFKDIREDRRGGQTNILTEEEIRMLCEEGRKVLLQQPMLIEMEGWFNGLSILLYSVLPRHQYILFCLFYLCMHFLFYRLFLCVHLF